MTTLAPYVRILGRGPGRSRSLDMTEAHEAMTLVLSGEARPEAIGGFLMLLRYRGECAEELAGFTRALRDTLPDWPGTRPAVDWPSYAAGRSRGLPFFLLSARLVARAGLPVLLHGWNSHQGATADLRLALPHAGITIADSIDDAGQLLGGEGICYVPLEAISPRALELLRLREVFGLRSCVNTMMRMMNPGGADLTVQGVFHPPYRGLQRDASVLLGQPASTTIKGGGGEFERHPGKPVSDFGQIGGTPHEITLPAVLDGPHTRLAEGHSLPETAESLTALWSGETEDGFALACITGTAALVLRAAGLAEDDPAALTLARRLWDTRHDTDLERKAG